MCGYPPRLQNSDIDPASKVHLKLGKKVHSQGAAAAAAAAAAVSERIYGDSPSSPLVAF
jgi:hypothetical protein